MTTKNARSVITAIMTAVSLVLVACAASPGSTPTPAASGPTQAPAATSIPTATHRPIPELSLKSGDFYFSLDGTQSFIFSRNVAGAQQSDYDTILGFTASGGSRLARIQLDSLGPGYTISGKVDEVWVTKWEQVFDRAEANGVYVMPVFAGWFDWNNGTPDYGYSTWKSNPFNEALGGPAKTPGELFQKDSATQKLWLAWVESLVRRWQGRKTIAAWEIFSEVNIASGSSERTGVDFVESAALTIRSADPAHRPVTASLADVREWPSFYRSDAIDFINFHPYPPSGKLDTYLISNIRQKLAAYQKPVLIGESGLSASAPFSGTSTLTTADKASLGIRHAIWAGIVSGAMNGRALYWEDGYGIYFPNLGFPFVEKYAGADLSPARFVQDVDFAGFKPLTVSFSGAPKITGAVVGSDASAIGWFRDAGCEPPDWKLMPVISKQSVTVTLPGASASWRVDFYDTKTGTQVTSSITVRRKGNAITIPLSDFTDDIAFRMTAQP